MTTKTTLSAANLDVSGSPSRHLFALRCNATKVERRWLNFVGGSFVTDLHAMAGRMSLVTSHLSLATRHCPPNHRFRDLNCIQNIENMRPRPGQINGKGGCRDAFFLLIPGKNEASSPGLRPTNRPLRSNQRFRDLNHAQPIENMKPRPILINGKPGSGILVFLSIAARDRAIRSAQLPARHSLRSNQRFRDLNHSQTIENTGLRPSQNNGKRGVGDTGFLPTQPGRRIRRQGLPPARHLTDCFRPEAYNARSMAQALIAIKPTRRLPPGPRGVNLLRQSLSFGHDWSGFLSRCAREYGDIVFFRFLNVPICLVADPEHIELILVKNSGNFLKARDYRALKAILGNGLLTSEGEFWQSQRKLIQPAFRHENIVTYARIMSNAATTMLSQWRDGETRDIHEDLMSATLEIVAKSLFGSDISKEARGVGQAMGVVMEQFIAQANYAFVLPDKIPTPKSKQLRRSMKHLDEVVFRLIRARRSAPRHGGDLLGMLLESQDDRGSRMTDVQLRDEIMTLFLAGHDTTANALSWTLYLLAQNPDAAETLYAELSSVLGERAPSVTDLPRLPFTEMVVKESMRIYPPAWGVGRRAIHDFELDGYTIPAKTNVFLLQWITQRDARFFPDPLRFEPERWRNDPIRSGRLPRFCYFPFGGGPRVCVGAGFAMMEATVLLATIAQRFRFTLAPKQIIEPLFSVTLRPKKGIRMILHERKNTRNYSVA